MEFKKKKHLTFINVQSFSCHSILQLFKEDLLLYNSVHVKSDEIKNWVEIKFVENILC